MPAYVVRITASATDVEPITTAAVMADATGVAEVSEAGAPDSVTMMVGFDSFDDAEDFAHELGGSTTLAQTADWSQTELSTITTKDGDIELEVGTAFGHGRHPTTNLALQALSELGPGRGRTLFDVGCGTGVVAIASALAGFVASGCDLDPDAVAIATRNADRNGVADRVSFVTATPTQLATTTPFGRSEGFDAVVVNTLVGVHESEGAAITKLVARHSPIIIGGIRGVDQLDRAAASYPGRSIESTTTEDGWLTAVLSWPLG